MKNKRYIHNERGVALLMVMVISAVILTITASMIYMLTTSTEISGLSKRYASASEAAQGAQDLVKRYLDWRGDPVFVAGAGITIIDDACISNKLLYDTEDWDPACSNLHLIDPDDSGSYDMEFPLGEFNVYAKITHTIEGNTGVAAKGGEWHNIGATHGTAGEITVPKVPYYYTVEIDASRRVGPSNDVTERSRISMLYLF